LESFGVVSAVLRRTLALRCAWAPLAVLTALCGCPSESWAAVTVIYPSSQVDGIGSSTGSGVWVASRVLGDQLTGKRIIRFAADGQETARFSVFEGVNEVSGDVHELPGGDLVVGGVLERTARFTAGGAPVWDKSGIARRLALVDGEIVASDPNSQYLVRRNPATGESPGVIDLGSGENPFGIAGLSDGTVLVAGTRSSPARRYTVGGQLVGTLPIAAFGSFGSVEHGSTGDEIYAANQSSTLIRRVGLDNTLRGTFDTAQWLDEVQDLALAGDVLWAFGSKAGSASVYHIVGINTQVPIAAVSTPAALVQTGERVGFDASASSVPFSAITRFEWDLDGDGGFETDTGSNPSAAQVYPSRGLRQVQVRVTAPSGRTAITGTSVDVRQTPPTGAAGVSINNGAQFTNTPEVSVIARWPRFATDLLLSNDGGFASPLSARVEASVGWKLDASGPERLPKTIYVRFSGGTSGAETYQDDIILDQTPPELRGVALEPPREQANGSSQLAKSRQFRVSSRASDATSGVAEMQLARSRTRPEPFRRYAATQLLRRASLPRWARVRDFAGNVSSWKSVTGSRAPTVRLNATRTLQLRTGRVRLRVRVDQRSKIVARLTLRKPIAKSLGLGATLIRKTATLSPRHRHTLRLRLSGPKRAKLRLRSSVRATLTVRASNAIGLTTSRRSRIVLVR